MTWFNSRTVPLRLSNLILFSGNGKAEKKHSLPPVPPGPFCMRIFGYLPFLGEISTLTISRLAKKIQEYFSVVVGQNKSGLHQMTMNQPRMPENWICSRGGINWNYSRKFGAFRELDCWSAGDETHNFEVFEGHGIRIAVLGRHHE